MSTESMSSGPLVLAADIGGTKTRLGVLARRGDRLLVVKDGVEASGGHRRPDVMLAEFAAGFPIAAVCVGVAGPVINGEVSATNLPWTLSEREIANALQLAHVRMINDLEANALGLDALGPSDFRKIQEGAVTGSVCAMISAGTGLGQAAFVRRGGGNIVVPSEGGHADLAPVDRADFAILDALWNRYGEHASVERVLSGPGLRELYFILRDLPGSPPADPQVAASIGGAGDASAEISGAALAGRCPLCIETMHRFVRFFGAEAGNLALRVVATGGVFIGGGIAPKILPALTDGRFLSAFLAKGRMRGLLANVPVSVVLNPDTALYGAALTALSLVDRPHGDHP